MAPRGNMLSQGVVPKRLRAAAPLAHVQPTLPIPAQARLLQTLLGPRWHQTKTSGELALQAHDHFALLEALLEALLNAQAFNTRNV